MNDDSFSSLLLHKNVAKRKIKPANSCVISYPVKYEIRSLIIVAYHCSWLEEDFTFRSFEMLTQTEFTI